MNVKANHDGLYAAFIAKDARFDGRFFVGISSTGIYCRPVCRARAPKETSCTFYETAAEAEQAGYRPCLLCRPELAPGRSITDAASNLARRAARLLEEDCRSGQSLATLAGRLGCTDRHLRRVFTSEYRIPPVRYLQTCRLLLAKNLLTDTELPIIDVAMTSGFGSLRRFNDLFKEHYGLCPSDLRKRSSSKGCLRETVTLQLGYRPPYRWPEILRFLERHATPGVEAVHNGEYFRTARHLDSDGKEVFGWLKVGHNSQKNSLSVEVSEALIPVLAQVLARIRHLFDLYCEPNTIYETLAPMNEMRPDLCVLGTRLPGSYHAFELAVKAVLAQGLPLGEVNRQAGGIVANFGVPLETGVKGLTHTFPSPEDLFDSKESSGGRFFDLGISAKTSKTIQSLAQAFSSGWVKLDLSSDTEQETEKLLAIEGIGQWAAHYMLMRTMAWPDVFVEFDGKPTQACEAALIEDLPKAAEAWRPWRSYAAVNLWNAAQDQAN